MKTLTIPAPKFDQYELVTLHWNDQIQKVKVTRRWLDLDDEEGPYWWYQLSNTEERYPEGVISTAESAIGDNDEHGFSWHGVEKQVSPFKGSQSLPCASKYSLIVSKLTCPAVETK